MRTREFLRAKVHGATVTRTDPDYEGSATVAAELLNAAGIAPFERVQVVNVTTGERLETYAIEGPAGTVGLNGAAAHRGSPGDTVIVMAYAAATPDNRPTPTVVHASPENGVARTERKEPGADLPHNGADAG